MSSHKDALRNAGEAAVKAIFLFQVVAGALGNALLFSCSISPVLLGHKQRPADTILTHVALSNLLFLLSSGIPHKMTGFLLRNPLSSLGCKLLYYIQRVTLSTALCSTSILSTYQAFTLIPRRAEWMMPRGRVIGPSCCTCWMLNLLTYISVLLKITGPQDIHNYSDTRSKWFCSASAPNAGFVYLWSISDTVFLTLMVWSSGSMVLLLLRHHQRVQYIHTSTGHHRCPPETRATRTILMLVVTFVVVYILNFTFCFYITVVLEFRLWLIQTSDVLASCFPTVSPFLLLLRDPRMPRICSGVGRNNA
ncbi:vomeronasal type-1 receptor 1-like isoform 1-T5 [Dama dama]|uniref:vomeronasal type-1 receptor 1-like n=1 Tax=Dama dama TaxID=30532 RepID=UPI002A36DD14|nr:vomeronasal type-1 receptor 1-like [Dama dama]XP_060996207.1 vomeronasal type-1 receptor 1-like [Dama dama]XP_060996208.1 vomeronasal type-1 receptor 1-like [Dama dama]XP_060996209.1 vomeronasal type-1 receptor 1-like [Dama dama]